MSVTAHGVAMAYVLTTFFIMGFGYFVAVTSLDTTFARTAVGMGRVLGGLSAWRILTVIPIAMGRATVLFTFYPPLTASALLLHWTCAGGGWRHGSWCLLMLVAMRAWKRDNPGLARAARHVCDGGECRHVAVDDGRCRSANSCSKSYLRRSA